MEACSFDQSNHVFSKPENWTDEQCTPLSVWVGTVAIGSPDNPPVPAIISCWKLTEAEFDHILKTKRIWLTIIGEGMPPVSLQVGSPFPELLPPIESQS